MERLKVVRRVQLGAVALTLVAGLLLTQRRVITVRNLAPTDVVVQLSLGDEQVEAVVPAGTRRITTMFEVVREGSLRIGIKDAAGNIQRLRCGYETVLLPHDFFVLIDGQNPRVAHCEPSNELNGWLPRQPPEPGR